jgi:hypothetical protein
MDFIMTGNSAMDFHKLSKEVKREERKKKDSKGALKSNSGP